MHARDVCALASRKLLRRWMRTAFSVIAVAAALAPLAVVASLQDGVREGLIQVLLSVNLPPNFALVTGHVPKDDPFSPPVLTTEDLDAIRARAGVVWVSELPNFSTAYIRLDGENESYWLQGCPREFLDSQATVVAPRGADAPIPVLLSTRYLTLRHWDEQTGRFDSKDVDARELLGRDLDLVVGDYVGKILPYTYKRRRLIKRSAEEMDAARRERLAGLATRFDLEKLGTGKVLKARVVGVSPTYATLIPLEDVKRWTDWRLARDREAIRTGVPANADLLDEDIDQVLVKIAPGADALALDHALLVGGFSCTSFELAREAAIEHLEMVVRIVRYAASGVMLLGLLVVAATLSRVASDSEREIGLYRAVGATRRQVMSVFVVQAALIGLAGGLVGVAAGNLGARAMSRWALQSAGASQLTGFVGVWWRNAMLEALPKTFYRFSPSASALILVAGLCVCVLASLVPSLRAAWRDPIRALRAE